MAQKRLLNKGISLSDKVNQLSDTKMQLFYTWSIAHVDDLGFLQSSPMALKGLIFPIQNVSIDEVSKYLKELLKVKLYKKVSYLDKEYLYIVGHKEEQIGLKRDRQPYSVIPLKFAKDPKTSWKDAEDLRDRLLVSKTNPNGIQKGAKS